MNFDVRDLTLQKYWHVTGLRRSTVLWNARLSNGWVPTMSMVRLMPGMQNAVAPHDFMPKLGKQLEQTWEEVRSHEFPVMLPRSGAIFLFDVEEAANASALRWFGDSEVVVVEARIHKSSRLHRGHLGWFEESPDNFENAAKMYWSGSESDRPPGHWECLVHGAVYFPDWQLPPFGSY